MSGLSNIFSHFPCTLYIYYEDPSSNEPKEQTNDDNSTQVRTLTNDRLFCSPAFQVAQSVNNFDSLLARMFTFSPLSSAQLIIANNGDKAKAIWKREKDRRLEKIQYVCEDFSPPPILDNTGLPFLLSVLFFSHLLEAANSAAVHSSRLACIVNH